jgi:hypothetical protein
LRWESARDGQSKFVSELGRQGGAFTLAIAYRKAQVGVAANDDKGEFMLLDKLIGAQNPDL